MKELKRENEVFLGAGPGELIGVDTFLRFNLMLYILAKLRQYAYRALSDKIAKNRGGG
jgi:hypothetical protein